MVDKRFIDEVKEVVTNHLKIGVAPVQETVANEDGTEVIQTRVKVTLYWMQGETATFIDDSEAVILETPVVTNPAAGGMVTP